MNQVLLLPHTPSEKHPHTRARLVRGAERSGRLLQAYHPPHDKVDVGCLAHAPHEDLGPADLVNARRRLDFYSRWHGLKEPRLQIWKAS